MEERSLADSEKQVHSAHPYPAQHTGLYVIYAGLDLSALPSSIPEWWDSDWHPHTRPEMVNASGADIWQTKDGFKVYLLCLSVKTFCTV